MADTTDTPKSSFMREMESADRERRQIEKTEHEARMAEMKSIQEFRERCEQREIAAHKSRLAYEASYSAYLAEMASSSERQAIALERLANHFQGNKG